MKRMKYLLTAFILSSALMSCNHRPMRNMLQNMEGYIQERPDSALTVLRSIDASSMTSRSLRAEYSLLYAMALDKNYIDTTDVSVVMPAVGFYRKHGTADKRSRAFYYLGRIHENRKEYSQALVYFLQALEASQAMREEDPYLKGLIYGSMTDSYNATYNAEEELEYARLSYESFEKYGNKDHIDLARFKLAQACHNNGLFDLADSLYTSVYAGSDSTASIAFNAMKSQISNDLWRDDTEVRRDLELFEYMVGHGGRLSRKYWYMYACLLHLAGEDDAAESVVAQLSGYADNGESLDIRYRLATFQGRKEDALVLLKELLEEQNAIVKKQLAQSVFKAQNDYYRLNAELSEQRTTIARQQIVIILIIGLISLMLMYVVFRKKRDALIEERKSLIQAVEETERLVLDMEQVNERERSKTRELRSMYVQLYQKQFREIGKYYDMASAHGPESVSTKVSRAISASVKALLEDISGDSEGQKKFEDRIDADLDGIISKIRMDFPKLNDNDLRFLSYMIVGFDTSTVSFLMDMSKENVRVKRYRLRAKLSGYAGPNEDLYGLFI